MPARVELCGSLAILNLCVLPYWGQEGWGVVKPLFCDSLLLLNLWKEYHQECSLHLWCQSMKYHMYTSAVSHTTGNAITIQLYRKVIVTAYKQVLSFQQSTSYHHFHLRTSIRCQATMHSYRHMHSFTPRMMVSIYKKRTLFSHHPHYVKKVWSLNCLFNQARTIS